MDASSDDASLVHAALADSKAWAAIYDRYADRLHDHCWSILRDPHEASDALHDTFIAAATALPRLRQPDRLRPWLYAIARNEALRRARNRQRMAPTAEVGAVTAAADVDDAADGADREALRTLVWDAADGLSANDRAVLDLHLRQGLEGHDLAEAMGVSDSHARVVLTRLRDQVERSLGALLVARTGRRSCPELRRLLEGWDGRLSPLLRKRVARHVDDCDECGRRRRALVSPLALLAAVPLVPAPLLLRDRVLGDVERISATRPIGRGPGGAGPGVGPGDSPTTARRRAVMTAAALAAVLALGGGALAVRAAREDHPRAVTALGGSTTTTTAAVDPPTSPPPSTSSTTSTTVTSPTAPAAPTTAAVATTAPTTTPTTAPPDGDGPGVDATADRTVMHFSTAPGCPSNTATVTAAVNDASAIASVTLRWAQGQDVHDVPMTGSGATWTGRIGPLSVPGDVTWSVTGVDALGNATTTSTATIPVLPPPC